jgi:hypothetical protein
VTEQETLRQHAEKIRELLGQPNRRRTPPLIDHDGVMRCQSQKCRKPFEDDETVFQVRYAGGIKTFCERCRWPSDTWVSLPCDNCRRPVYRFLPDVATAFIPVGRDLQGVLAEVP